jgi:hypothetical protein
MQPLQHKYPFSRLTEFHRIFFDILGLLSAFFFFFYPIIDSIVNHIPMTVGDIFQNFLHTTYICLCCLIVGNFCVNIMSDEMGLHINFLWKHLVVSWEEIIDTRPIFNIPFLRNISVIRTSSLTPFHRLLGLLYSFSIAPSIIYIKGMSNYDELNRRIGIHLQKNKKNKGKTTKV